MRVMTKLMAVVCVLALPGVARAQGVESVELLDSQSIGRTEGGRLDHGFPLEPTDSLVVVRPHRYGTRELVGMLRRGASRVARSFPGSKLAVGDLSAENGGHLSPHVSHQTGRDADIGFYVIDSNGVAAPQAVFTRFGEDGTGRRRNGVTYTFDDARNWALLVAFLDDPVAGVQHVLIASHLRERLLAHGRAISASEDDIERVRLATMPIRGSENHDDHFHVRIYCPVGDRPECLDAPPLHPWYDGTPSPDAVLAARVADLQRAAALRREQDRQRRILEEMRNEEERQRDAERERAAALARQPGVQASAERRRAAELARAARAQEAARRLLDRELEQMLRREATAERRRATELRRELSNRDSDERRRAAEMERQVAAANRAGDFERAVDILRDWERRAASDQRALEREQQRMLRRHDTAADRRLREIQRRAERQLEAERRRRQQQLE